MHRLLSVKLAVGQPRLKGHMSSSVAILTRSHKSHVPLPLRGQESVLVSRLQMNSLRMDGFGEKTSAFEPPMGEPLGFSPSTHRTRRSRGLLRRSDHSDRRGDQPVGSDLLQKSLGSLSGHDDVFVSTHGMAHWDVGRAKTSVFGSES